MNKNKKISISKQEPQKRIKNFKEVCLGYTSEQARKEASRCLECKDEPCVEGCPVNIDIPKFIIHIKEGRFQEAINTIKEKNALPGICGRVCPQEEQCEKVCRMGKIGQSINIGKLERFAADWEILSEDRGQGSEVRKGKRRTSHRIAIVGSGPASLTCAGELAKLGYEVTIFEALHETGGVLKYGIPEFRLPKEIVDTEIEYVKSLGVKIETDVVVGVTLTIADLFIQGYKAIFLGTGAGLPYFMNIPGENLNSIYSANEFLTRANLMKAYKFPEYDTPLEVGRKVAVIGGGNTAMDSARVAKRMGAEDVMIIYRRSQSEMPARDEEIENAQQEGIEFKLLANPVRYLSDGKSHVRGVECIKMKLGEPDESGRRRPIPIEGSNYIIDIDTVVVAIGQGPNPLLSEHTPDLKVNKWGNIEVDSNGMTSIEGVFAGGDIVTGEGTVIAAMGDAKRIAKNIDEYVKQ